MMSHDITTSVPGSKIVTMSSREIAEITDKRHKNVCRDIRAMAQQLYPGMDINGLRSEPNNKIKGLELCFYLDKEGRRRAEFQLDHDHTHCLIAGYSVQHRMQIIQRLREHEEAAHAPPAPALPQNYLEALEALVETEKARQTLEHQATINAPKVECYDALVEHDEGEMTISEAAKTMPAHFATRKSLKTLLQEMKWLQQDGKYPYQSVTRQGYMRLRLYEYRPSRHSTTPVITSKGMTALQAYVASLHNGFELC